MVIQLPRDIEDELNELASRKGTPADELAVDAITTMLQRERSTAARHRPHVVLDDGGEASGMDVWGDEDPPWAGLIGMFPGGGVDSEGFEDWLEAERASDERLARKSTPSG